MARLERECPGVHARIRYESRMRRQVSPVVVWIRSGRQGPVRFSS